MNNNIKYPQFISVDKLMKAKYLEPLINESNSMFYKREAGEVYFLSAALGLKNGLSKKSTKIENLRLYERLNDQYKLLIRIIALVSSKYNYDILLNGQKTLKIIEEHANGGAQLLYESIFKGKGLDFSLEDEIWEIIKSNPSK